MDKSKMQVLRPGDDKPTIEVTESSIRAARDFAVSERMPRNDDDFFVLFVGAPVRKAVWEFGLSIGVMVNPSMEEVEKYMPLTHSAIVDYLKHGERSHQYGVVMVGSHFYSSLFRRVEENERAGYSIKI